MNAILNNISSPSSLPLTAIIVLALHIVIMATLGYLETSALNPREQKQRIVVKTIEKSANAASVKVASKKDAGAMAKQTPRQVAHAIAPAPKTKASTNKDAKAKASKVQSQEKAAPKVNEKASKAKTNTKAAEKDAISVKKEAKKQESPKSAAKPQEQASKGKAEEIVKGSKDISSAAQAGKDKRLSLMAQAQKSIAKIAKESHDSALSRIASASTAAIIIPDLLEEELDILPKEGQSSSNDALYDYRSRLVLFLKMRLKLPEKGEVQVKLTLAKDGKVLNLAIIKTASRENREHVERMLPTLTFPVFDDSLGSVDEISFRLNLNSY